MCGQSVGTLLGGGYSPAGVRLYRAIGQDTPDKMAELVGKYQKEG